METSESISSCQEIVLIDEGGGAMAEKIGDTIKRLRLAKGLSQKDFAERLGKTPQLVSVWERNRSYPGGQNLVEIAAAFGIALDESLGASGPEGHKVVSLPSREPTVAEMVENPNLIDRASAERAAELAGFLGQLIDRAARRMLSVARDHPVRKKGKGPG